MIEIRWHGRGGQGTKTAALWFADVVFARGMYVQGFPEYGPERTGAPLTAYNRLSDKRIRIHSNIYRPDYIIIVDETQIGEKVIEGIKESTKVIVNAEISEEEIFEKLKVLTPLQKQRLIKVPASAISRKHLGRVLPNLPMLTALIHELQIYEDEDYIELISKEIKEKFGSNQNIVDGNISGVKETIKYLNEKYPKNMDCKI